MPTPTHQSHDPRRARIAAAVPLLALLSCAALSACGGSSHATSASKTGTQSVTPLASLTTTNTATAQTGQQPAGGTGHTGGTPSGATNNRSTGGGGGGQTHPGPIPPASQGSSSQHAKFPPAFLAALKTFTSCVRGHGVSIPEPNLSGHGEIFPRTAINPNSPSYHSAILACEPDLIAILRAAGASHLQGIG